MLLDVALPSAMGGVALPLPVPSTTRLLGDDVFFGGSGEANSTSVLSIFSAGSAGSATGRLAGMMPCPLSTEFLRSRLTSRTDLNHVSLTFCCAVWQLSSVGKLANAQLLLAIKKSDCRPSVCWHTWCTSSMSSVCGGKFPIHIAWPLCFGFLGGPRTIVAGRICCSLFCRFVFCAVLP